MYDELSHDRPKEILPVRYKFHPLVRVFMIILASITASYSIFFITILIPRYETTTFFFKILAVLILYISIRTIYKHLTSLNSVIIYSDRLELLFLIKRNILIPWDNLKKIEIYKVITHYWKVEYYDNNGMLRSFKTSLAFPGIINILLSIQDKKPDIELNELLRQVLLYKRSKI